MPSEYKLVALDREIPTPTSPPDWLWSGYVARRVVTLLTGKWKVGKTTLITALLRHLTADGTFLDRPCRAARTLIVSEESKSMWASRLRAIPVGSRADLIARPFLGRPTPDEWNRLVDQAERMRAGDDLDLVVIDPLAAFLPGRSESDPGSLSDLFDPLRRLAETGVAILVLHHPRKEKAEAGRRARGGRALLGFVDIVLELGRYGTTQPDERRRRLSGFSRYPDTPWSVVYEWVPGTADFRSLGNPPDESFRVGWEQVRSLLAARDGFATHGELWDDWPSQLPPPSRQQLYHWLNRAFTKGLVKRTGNGTRGDPYRYRVVSCDLSAMSKIDPLGPMDEL